MTRTTRLLFRLSPKKVTYTATQKDHKPIRPETGLPPLMRLSQAVGLTLRELSLKERERRVEQEERPTSRE